MADTKTIQFKFVVDPQSVSQVKRVLQELTVQAENFAKVMKSAGGGFFGGGQMAAGAATRSSAQTIQNPAGGGAITSMVGGIRREAEEGVKGLQKLTNETRRSVDSQTRDFGNLSKVLENVIQKFRQFSTPQGALRGIGQMLSGGGGAPGYMQGNAMPGTGMDIGGISGMGMLRALGTIGAVGAAGVATFKASRKVFDYAQLEQMRHMTDQGMYGDTFIKPWQSLYQGDPTQLYAAQAMTARDKEAIETKTGWRGDVEYGIHHPLDWAATQLGLRDSDKYRYERDSFKEKARQEMYDAKAHGVGFQREITGPREAFEATMGSRIAAERILGLKTGTRQYADVLEVGKNFWGYGDEDAALTAQGYDLSQKMSAYVGLRGQAGAAGGKFAWQSMAASAAGYSGYDSLLAAQATMGPQSKIAAYAMGGPLQGRGDKQLAIQLGQMAAGSGFDVMGQTGRVGYLEALQGGVKIAMNGGMSAAAAVQQAAAGAELAGGIFAGSSPLQQSRNLLAAISADAGGGYYAQTALASTPYPQIQDAVRNNQVPENLARKGVTIGMLRKYAGSVMSSALYDYVATGNNPEDRAVQKYQQSGMDLDAYLATPAGKRDRRALAGAARASHPELAGEEGFQGAFGQWGAPIGTARTGKGPGGAITGAAKAKAEQEARKKLEDERKIKLLESSLIEKYGATGKAAGLLEVDESAAHTAGVLDRLGEAGEKVLDVFISFASGQKVGHTSARATAPAPGK